MKDSKENTKIKLINKIFVSFLALLLVFSSVTSYQFQQKSTQVQANEFTFDSIHGKLLAIILAAIGVTVVSNEIALDMQQIYNNLDSNTQAVLQGFDTVNNHISGYYRLTYEQLSSLALGLVDTLKLDTLEPGKNYYFNDKIYSYLPVLSLVKGNTTTSGNFTETTYTSSNFVGPIYERKYRATTTAITSLNFNGTNYDIGGAYGILELSNSYGYFLGETFSDIALTPGVYYLGSKFTCTTLTAGTIDYCSSRNNKISRPYIQGTWKTIPATASDLEQLFKLMTLGGLSSVVDKPNNQLQLPPDWSKKSGEAFVIGGLTGTVISNLVPVDVLLPPTAPDPFTPPALDPDPIVIEPTPIPDPTLPVTDLPSLWGAITGATAAFLQNLFAGLQPIIDLLQGIKTFLQTMVQPVVDAIVQLGLDLITGLTTAFQTMLQTLLEAMIVPFMQAFAQLWTWDITTTQLKIEELRQLMFLRIPCVNETLEAWYKIIAVNGHNLTSSFTIFGHTYTWSSGSLLQAFSQFASLIQQAFRFVFWFIFLKGMRRRITAFLSAMSVER